MNLQYFKNCLFKILKTIEDRKARRLARGLPAEYTEEELEQMKKKQEEQAEEAFKKRNVRTQRSSLLAIEYSHSVLTQNLTSISAIDRQHVKGKSRYMQLRFLSL